MNYTKKINAKKFNHLNVKEKSIQLLKYVSYIYKIFIHNSWFSINKGQKPVEIILVDPKLIK